MTNATDTIAEQLTDLLDSLAELVGAIETQQLAVPTPCADFDVAELRRHILGWLTLFATGFLDPQGRAPADIDDYTVSAHPAAEVRDAAKKLVTGLRHGAGERTFYFGESGMPGELTTRMILWEYVVHGWDLATATGRAWNPPQQAVTDTLEFVPSMLTEDYQGPGKPFAPAIPIAAEAPALDRLLARCGRNPHWAPPTNL